MNITTELWKEYCAWCRENAKNGYTAVYAPDFIEFMAYLENKGEL